VRSGAQARTVPTTLSPSAPVAKAPRGGGASARGVGRRVTRGRRAGTA
jgi:hypothetical protein